MLRSCVGVGLGGAHVPVALYMEFVPTRLRGILLVALQSFWTLGTMIEVRVPPPPFFSVLLLRAGGFQAQFSRWENLQALLGWAVLADLGWRWLLAISSIPLFLLMLLYPVVPESPYWLAAAGHTEKAQIILAKVARVNRTSLPPGRLKVVAASGVSHSPRSLNRERSSHLSRIG